MQILQHTFPVPSGTAYKTVALFKSNGKVGRISLNFINQVAGNINNQPVAVDKILVNMYESNDGTNWTLLNQSPIACVSGADTLTTVSIRSSFFRIQAKGNAGKGGSMRLHASYEGRLFQGQLDVLELGKSGYGYDGQTGKGQADYSSTPWPDGAPS